MAETENGFAPDTWLGRYIAWSQVARNQSPLDFRTQYIGMCLHAEAQMEVIAHKRVTGEA